MNDPTLVHMPWCFRSDDSDRDHPCLSEPRTVVPASDWALHINAEARYDSAMTEPVVALQLVAFGKLVHISEMQPWEAKSVAAELVTDAAFHPTVELRASKDEMIELLPLEGQLLATHLFAVASLTEGTKST